MIDEFDKDTKRLIDEVTPRWHELRVEKVNYARQGEMRFQTQTVLLAGESSSLLCAMDAWDFVGEETWEYFPIVFRIVDADRYAPDEWTTLAREGGASDLDRKLQWLFETPSLTLTEGVEEFGKGEGASRKSYAFRFYNGLLISDPKGRGSLRLTASDMPDFVLTGEFNFGPCEA